MGALWGCSRFLATGPVNAVSLLVLPILLIYYPFLMVSADYAKQGAWPPASVWLGNVVLVVLVLGLMAVFYVALGMLLVSAGLLASLGRDFMPKTDNGMVELEVIPAARHYGMGLIPWSPLGGGLLGALATCGTFVCESVAQEMGIPLQGVTVTAAGDFDPRGLCGAEEINPRMQGFRVRLALAGPNEEQGQALAQAFRTRCPVFTTFVRAAPIELEVEVLSG